VTHSHYLAVLVPGVYFFIGGTRSLEQDFSMGSCSTHIFIIIALNPAYYLTNDRCNSAKNLITDAERDCCAASCHISYYRSADIKGVGPSPRFAARPSYSCYEPRGKRFLCLVITTDDDSTRLRLTCFSVSSMTRIALFQLSSMITSIFLLPCLPTILAQEYL
jgi:hypothetical protein